MFPLNAHIKMLADKVRLSAYRRSVFQTVSQGDLVVDIGTGTGILAFFALQAGAERVYAIESGPIIDIAKKTAKDNDLLDRIVFIHEDSRKVEIPELVDVIITETIGGLGIDEGVVDIISDARKRFLKSEGRIIPSSLTIKAAPVCLNGLHPFLYLEEPIFDNQFSYLKELAANNVHLLHLSHVDQSLLLSPPSEIFFTNFYQCGTLNYPVRMQAHFEIEKMGTLHGTLLFLEVELSEEITISLLKGQETHWDIPFFPISRKVQLAPGDRLSFHMTFTKSNGFVWQNYIERQDKEEIVTQLSTFGLPSLQHLTADRKRKKE